MWTRQEPKPYQPREASVQRSSQFVDSTYLKYMPNTHMREPPSAPVELERNESAGKLLKPSHQRPGHVSASSASRRDLVGAALYGNSFKHWTYSSKENLPLSEADRVPVYKSREEKWERRERDMTQHYSDPREVQTHARSCKHTPGHAPMGLFCCMMHVSGAGQVQQRHARFALDGV